MTPDIDDKVTYVAFGTKTELVAPGYTEGQGSINANDLSEWPGADTALFFAMDRVDSAGDRINGTYTEWKAIKSGGSLGSMELVGGVDQDYPAGSTTRVYMVLTAAWANSMADAILVEHNKDGTHDATKVAMLAGTQTLTGTKTFSATPVVPDGSWTYAKLLSTIFSGQVISFTNGGTGGGTFHYVNLGGIKILWGQTASQPVGTGGGTITVTLPTSFFNTIQYAAPSLGILGTDPRQWCYLTGVSTSTITIGIQSSTNGSNQQTELLVIGS